MNDAFFSKKDPFQNILLLYKNGFSFRLTSITMFRSEINISQELFLPIRSSFSAFAYFSRYIYIYMVSWKLLMNSVYA